MPPLTVARRTLGTRPASLRGRAWLVVANLAAITGYLLDFSQRGVGFGPYRIDLNVYRIGGRVWLAHGHLYGFLPPTRSGVLLPFTYPPFAAALLSPLALPSMAVAGTLLTLASIALTALVLRLFLRSAAATAAAAAAVAAMGSWWTVAWLLPVALVLEPVRNTLDYGQVNVLLMALVSADCLVETPRWPRGALLGLAAAVKLTPAAFILFFLARRDWRAVRWAVTSFLAATGAGCLLSWHDSVRFWSSAVFHAARPGHPSYVANQSIMAVLARAGLGPHAPAGVAAWLVLSAVAVGLAWLGMRRAVNRGTAVGNAWALSLNALAGLLASPISWTHHWVWCAPALLTLLLAAWRAGNRAGLAITGTGIVLFVVAPPWWFPHPGNINLHLAPWEQVVSSAYVIYAVAVLLASAGWRYRLTATSHELAT